MDRRRFCGAALAAPFAFTGAGCARRPRWNRSAYRKPSESRVAVLRAESYERPLSETILAGLRLFGLAVRGKTVVLKPNFVEYERPGVVNTHVAVVVGALDAFRRLGARRVVVAEGPGHQRDTEQVLIASGLAHVLRDHEVEYVDLNTDDVRRVALRSRFTDLGSLYLPETVLGADLLVSMPKMKTHHWAGVTLSLKNLFGIVPGSVYGWPKNRLHWAGINESIVDINASIPVQRFAIVDGIVGMDGNGPIQGDAKPCGVLAFGDDLVAVDATCARLMSIEPLRVRYLDDASQFLGNAAKERIVQIGEAVEGLRQDFRVIPAFERIKA